MFTIAADVAIIYPGVTRDNESGVEIFTRARSAASFAIHRDAVRINKREWFRRGVRVFTTRPVARDTGFLFVSPDKHR